MAHDDLDRRMRETKRRKEQRDAKIEAEFPIVLKIIYGLSDGEIGELHSVLISDIVNDAAAKQLGYTDKIPEDVLEFLEKENEFIAHDTKTSVYLTQKGREYVEADISDEPIMDLV